MEVTTYLTDGSGQATVPVMPGMEYLIDSVVLFEADPETGPDDAVWESLWASLTFQVPGDAR